MQQQFVAAGKYQRGNAHAETFRLDDTVARAVGRDPVTQAVRLGLADPRTLLLGEFLARDVADTDRFRITSRSS